MSQLVSIAAGSTRVVLAPANGGAVVSYTEEGRDWLRPSPPVTPATASRELGCFPLVPFFGRIRDGILRWDGREIRLPHNVAGIAHAVQGHGWQRPWTVTAHGPDQVEMAFVHRPDEWPWHYKACQRAMVTADGALTLALSVTNLDDQPMPSGLGFHPYFARSPGASIRARMSGMWESDEALMPVRLGACDSRLAEGVAVDDLDVDHVFVGWQGGAELSLAAGRLELTAAPGISRAVIVSGPRRPFFVFEPVTHLTDAFNRAAAGEADTGTVVLAPGQTQDLSMTLRPRGL